MTRPIHPGLLFKFNGQCGEKVRKDEDREWQSKGDIRHDHALVSVQKVGMPPNFIEGRHKSYWRKKTEGKNARQ